MPTTTFSHDSNESQGRNRVCILATNDLRASILAQKRHAVLDAASASHLNRFFPRHKANAHVK